MPADKRIDPGVGTQRSRCVGWGAFGQATFTSDDFTAFGLVKTARELCDSAAETALAILNGAKPADFAISANQRAQCFFHPRLARASRLRKPPDLACAEIPARQRIKGSMATSKRRQAPAKARQELVRRILASPQFASAESLRKIVLFLFDRSNGSDTPVKEHEIATLALGRPTTFDPKIDPIVRVSIASIRDRLQQFFDQEGRSEKIRISIPKGRYRLDFKLIEDDCAARVQTESSVRARFWQPYLSPVNPNLIVFTDLLFFRDDDNNYLRNIYVNDRATGADEIRSHLSLDPRKPLLPSFHFVSAGEMNCLLSITRMFAEFGAALDYRNARFFAWADARRANLILLGSARTNPFVRSLQGNLPLVSVASGIEERTTGTQWTGYRYLDGDLEHLVEYALVTRRAGPVAGAAVTMISANHGRAIEGAGAFLTNESHLRGLEEAFGKGGLPSQFQLLLRVEMLDYDEEVIDVAYLTHRTLPATS